MNRISNVLGMVASVLLLTSYIPAQQPGNMSGQQSGNVSAQQGGNTAPARKEQGKKVVLTNEDLEQNQNGQFGTQSGSQTEEEGDKKSGAEEKASSPAVDEAEKESIRKTDEGALKEEIASLQARLARESNPQMREMLATMLQTDKDNLKALQASAPAKSGSEAQEQGEANQTGVDQKEQQKEQNEQQEQKQETETPK